MIRGRNLSHVSATMTRMTSSSPVPAAVRPDPPRRDAGSPTGGLGSAAGPPLWFLANCDPCGSDLAQPFRSQVERDAWAIAHLLGTGHTVGLSVDEVPSDAHLSAFLRNTPDSGGFRWLCMAPECARWIGPYGTPQLALADWRGHAIRIGVAR